jgi:hypothetical protein
MVLRFSEQAATFPLYIINTLVFATQTDFANSAVQTKPLNVIRIILRLKRKKISPMRCLDILV